MLFASTDGLDWQLADRRPSVSRRLVRDDGTVQEMARLERPQLFMENGRPRRLFLAARPDDSEADACNLSVGVDWLAE